MACSLEHKKCKGRALALTHQIGYRLYELRIMGLDGCVTASYLKEIEELDNKLATLRRALQSFGEEKHGH